MPMKLQKSLQDYLSKTGILSGCKHPKTLSFAIDNKQGGAHGGDDAATLADVDRFLFENFRSLFLRDDGPESQKRERFTEPPPDVFDPRVFTARPLTEESPASATASSEEFESSCSASSSNKHGKIDVSIPNDCIAISTSSLNPWKDFRRSMQEIVEEHLENEGDVDWNFMRELLLCYLDLNEKKSHKYILNAFVDLIVILRRRSAAAPARTRNIRVLKLSGKAKRR